MNETGKSVHNRQGVRMKICEEFWDEFMVTAKMLYMLNEEADIYDVFEYLRSHQQGASAYGYEFLRRIDAEIERKEGPLEHPRPVGRGKYLLKAN
jgi:hypothetical protein